jgi:CDP-diacylglycerol--serine O-phosphatidyltransferase
MIKHLPNFLTSLNLIAGFVAIIISFNPDTLAIAPYLVFAATIIDFLDGFTARILKAYSPLGKQLDSLADLVSFGIAPGIIAFQLVKISLDLQPINNQFLTYFLLFLPALIPLFSALRLAKFNIDERQTSSFIGLATPSSAVLISSVLLVFLNTDSQVIMNLIINKIALSALIIIDSYLMVSSLPMFSLKFKSAAFNENKVQYIFLGLALILLIIFKLYSLPMIVLLYIIMSCVNNVAFKTEV